MVDIRQANEASRNGELVVESHLFIAGYPIEGLARLVIPESFSDHRHGEFVPRRDSPERKG